MQLFWLKQTKGTKLNIRILQMIIMKQIKNSEGTMYTHFTGWKSWAEKLFSPYSLNLFCAFAGYGTLSELNQLQLERILLALLAFFPSCYMFRDISSAYELRSRKITKDLFSKGDRSFLPQEFISENPRDIFWNSTKHLIFQHCAFFVQASSFQF